MREQDQDRRQKMQRGDSDAGFAGQVISITGKIFDALVLGLLFLLCSIPVFTIGASATALYYAYDKVIRREEGYTVKAFSHAFRQNFKQATILWIFDGALLAVLLWNIRCLFYAETSNGNLFLMILYGLFFLVVLMAAVTMFAALARFDMDTLWFLRFGFTVPLLHLGTALVAAAGLFCMAAIGYRYPVFLLVLPAAGIALVNMLYAPVLKKYEPKNDDKTDWVQ